MYTAYFVDRATERLFTDFFSSKDQLLSVVERTTAHMIMEARESMWYDGKQDRTAVRAGDQRALVRGTVL